VLGLDQLSGAAKEGRHESRRAAADAEDAHAFMPASRLEVGAENDVVRQGRIRRSEAVVQLGSKVRRSIVVSSFSP
jgi:hypothetical protein